eukprot:TRINITY_DN17190_c0_g1_i1.p1 TRINITY_DN17190_c0_g1~~TRINITY_DN17190_c0_g1_i1.p1  ORF type:complete len:143 (-),score=52.78 TRINITY_DN17190_c0_g1_i1:38-466(-)
MSEEYDEDGQAPEAPVAGEKSDEEYRSEVSARVSEVTKLLNGGKAAAALPLALADPPTHCKNQDIKDQNATAVLNVLTGVGEKGIDAAVAGLNADQLDILMKYIYRGLATGENASLLKWHESVLKKSGLGSVVRVLTDRKTV